MRYYHTVTAGDTLTALAKKYGTTVEALVASNGIKDKNFIKIGQVLLIPTNNSTPQPNNQIYNAFITCLDAIEALPEFKQLEALLHG